MSVEAIIRISGFLLETDGCELNANARPKIPQRGLVGEGCVKTDSLVIGGLGQENLEVDVVNVSELLDYHNQEQTMNELKEMLEQDIEKLVSLDAVQSKD
ncbi:hypothetical protein TNCV_4419991 [Trichonephila clavipes]|nr:hypothetical protein TNCV_4419991 [Trichonephila clavipes]